MEFKNIELYFLNSILRISIVGVLLILVSNVIFYPSDLLSISIEIIILTATIIAYFLRTKYPTTAVIMVTSITLAAISFQKWMTPGAPSALATILVIGFVVSVLLKGKVLIGMHAMVMFLLVSIFALPEADPITSSVTFIALYFVLVFGTYKIKAGYDQYRKNLLDANEVLQKQTIRMERQNKKHLKTQKELNELNEDLEKRVKDRTALITEQNETLIRYSYTNAHHLRGPVARLLGLASVYKMESKEEEPLVGKMVEQAKEIDTVIKQINVELAKQGPDSSNH